MLTPEGIEHFCDCYLPGLTDDERRAPEISPAFADLRDLPPALRERGHAPTTSSTTPCCFAGRYAAAGNEVELFVAPDMPHGFQAFPCGITTAWAKAFDAWLTARLG